MYYESLVFFYKRMRLFTNLLACMRFLPRPEDNPIEDEELVRMALQSVYSRSTLTDATECSLAIH